MNNLYVYYFNLYLNRKNQLLSSRVQELEELNTLLCKKLSNMLKLLENLVYDIIYPYRVRIVIVINQMSV